ncbi:MAG TPA: 4a-hydroxytetrahydrobiopterin dehydratase [Polyangia bacterium]|nr:4a-hydroxytetrahydrobiopterin dehydratase [Polyangia bacterium]
MTKKLSQAEVDERLGALAGWTLAGGKLHREYKFKSFVDAFGWMTSVALRAEKADHHPEWFNVYSTVKVDLTTHDAGGISEKDFALAHEMEKLAAGRV